MNSVAIHKLKNRKHRFSMFIKIILFSFFLSTIYGCTTFKSANGKRQVQLFPVRIKQNRYELDTSKYKLQQFSEVNFKNKTGKENNKILYELVTSNDVTNLISKQGTYFIIFWNPQCPSSIKNIRFSDSLLNAGESVMLLSLNHNYNAIDKRLNRYKRYNYPYYIMANNKKNSILLKAKIKFIKESCEHCYQKYKDEVATYDYLLIENGHIEGKMINNRTKK